MKFTIQYVPLKKIKNDGPVDVIDKISGLKKVMLDCMHLLVVKKNKGQDSYRLLSGHSRLQYLVKHTNFKYVPCIIANTHGNNSRAIFYNVLSKFNKRNPSRFQIIKTFINEEPEYKNLTLIQKVKILLIGLNYKRIVISSMKSKIKHWK